jgi:hypothetical protein
MRCNAISSQGAKDSKSKPAARRAHSGKEKRGAPSRYGRRERWRVSGMVCGSATDSRSSVDAQRLGSGKDKGGGVERQAIKSQRPCLLPAARSQGYTVSPLVQGWHREERPWSLGQGRLKLSHADKSRQQSRPATDARRAANKCGGVGRMQRRRSADRPGRPSDADRLGPPKGWVRIREASGLATNEPRAKEPGRPAQQHPAGSRRTHGAEPRPLQTGPGS